MTTAVTLQPPAHKSQRLSISTPFLHLPDDTFLVIFEYCQDEDLHFAIPFICKRIRNLLKRLAIQESKFPTTNADAVQFMKTHSAIEENLLWKKKCVALAPELKLATNELYFSFRKLYLRTKKLQAPLYHLRFEVDGLSKLLASLHNNFNDIREITRMGPENMKITNNTDQPSTKQVYNNKIKEMMKQLGGAKRFVGNMLLPQLDESTQKISWGKQYFAEHEELIQFLKCTCVHNDESTERSDRACMVQILSPVNGNKVDFMFEIEYPSDSDDDEYLISSNNEDVRMNVRLIEFGSEATTHSAQLKKRATEMVRVPADTIYNAAVHLGIEDTTKNTTASAKMKLIHRIWYEIVFYVFDILSYSRLYTRDDFPKPVEMWKTAEQIFQCDVLHSENRKSWSEISYEQQKKYLKLQNESKQKYDKKMAEFEQMSNTWYETYRKAQEKKKNDEAARNLERAANVQTRRRVVCMATGTLIWVTD